MTDFLLISTAGIDSQNRSVDLRAMIAALMEDRKRIDRAIACLETLAGEGDTGRSRRGRTSMPEAERQKVSLRMKRYWDRRRKARGPRVDGGSR